MTMAVIAIAFLAPAVSYAQTTASDGGVGSAVANDSGFQLVSCTGVVDPRTGKGVECDYNQLIATFNRLIQFVLWLVTPIVIGMMVYTGFKYMTAGGDMNMIADAKKMFTPIIIGIFFIFAGWLIVYTVLDKLLDTQVSGTGSASQGSGIQKGDIIPGATKVGL